MLSFGTYVDTIDTFWSSRFFRLTLTVTYFFKNTCYKNTHIPNYSPLTLAKDRFTMHFPIHFTFQHSESFDVGYLCLLWRRLFGSHPPWLCCRRIPTGGTASVTESHRGRERHCSAMSETSVTTVTLLTATPVLSMASPAASLVPECLELTVPCASWNLQKEVSPRLAST